jgi:large subunit ribosomal protein L19
MNSAKTALLKLTPVNIESRKKIDFRSGDTVRVTVRVLEDAAKQKFRLQAFEGTVIARKHGKETGATFTVRKVASGVGVERVFPLFSPIIDEILITKRSDVRRSKLYYIRDKAIRDVRRKMKNTLMVKESTKQFETKDAPVVEEQAEVEGTENTQA